MIKALRVVLIDHGGAPSRMAALFATAFEACGQVERTYVFGGQMRVAEPARESVVILHNRGERPLLQLIHFALRTDAIHLVVCQDQHALPMAALLAWLRGARLATVLSDNRSWQAPQSRLACWFARRIDGFVAFDEAMARQFSRWSGVPRDRGFLMRQPRLDETWLAPSGLEADAFAGDVADWLWGV